MQKNYFILLYYHNDCSLNEFYVLVHSSCRTHPRVYNNINCLHLFDIIYSKYNHLYFFNFCIIEFSLYQNSANLDFQLIMLK